MEAALLTAVAVEATVAGGAAIIRKSKKKIDERRERKKLETSSAESLEPSTPATPGTQPIPDSAALPPQATQEQQQIPPQASLMQQGGYYGYGPAGGFDPQQQAYLQGNDIYGAIDGRFPQMGLTQQQTYFQPPTHHLGGGFAPQVQFPQQATVMHPQMGGMTQLQGGGFYPAHVPAHGFPQQVAFGHPQLGMPQAAGMGPMETGMGMPNGGLQQQGMGGGKRPSPSSSPTPPPPAVAGMLPGGPLPLGAARPPPAAEEARKRDRLAAKFHRTRA